MMSTVVQTSFTSARLCQPQSKGLFKEAGTLCAGQDHGMIRHNTGHVNPQGKTQYDEDTLTLQA